MRIALLPALFFAAGAPAGLPAHDDDPKLIDRRPAYPGPGYRSAARRDAAGQLRFESPPKVFGGDGLTLLAWLPVGEFGVHQNANDCWGYVSPSGREYALLGLSGGTAFVDITSPGDPVVVDVWNSHESLWRDIKTYGHYAYTVSEGGGSLLVFDLSKIDAGEVDFVQKVIGPGPIRTHNLAIDTTSGFAYRCGGGDQGLRIYDLADPANPVHVGTWPDRYVHDAQVVTYTEGPYAGMQVAFACTGFNGGFVDPGLHILDVTDKQNIVELAFVKYQHPVYSHQAWLSPDRQYLYLNDESDEGFWGTTATHVLDVSDLENPVDRGAHLGTTSAIGHNLYTVGDLIFEANYTSGLRILDASDPLAMTEVAHYDTWQSNDNQGFHGLWSVYPYFPSGIVIGSDLEKGLFVWWYGDPPLDLQHPEGLPAPVSPEGQTLVVEVTETTPGDLVAGSVTLHYAVASGATVSVPMTEVSAGRFEAALPALACGTTVEYWFSAEAQNGVVWRSPEGAPAGAVHTTAALGDTILFADDFENDTGSWTRDSDPSASGTWKRVKPAASSAQPGSDVTADGVRCYVTGNHWEGAEDLSNDLDDGETRLILDPIDLSSSPEVLVEYWRWFSNDLGASVDDSFSVDVSNDGGDSWVNVETIGPGHPESHGGWYFHGFRLRDYVPVTDEVSLRFRASDFGSPSVVEAAIDEVVLREALCGDCNTNGVSDAFEIEEGLVVDLDGDGTPDECGPFWVDTLELSVSAGGTQQLFVNAGAELGGQLYWILGSFSGIDPGLSLGAEHLPLNPDAYFDLTLTAPNVPPLTDTLGNLDGAGEAQAAFALGAGANPGFVGLELHHAYLVADAGSESVLATSPAVSLSLVP